jgi:hypothetical protein
MAMGRVVSIANFSYIDKIGNESISSKLLSVCIYRIVIEPGDKQKYS